MFFDRVYLVSLTIHINFSSLFLLTILVKSIEDGHICKPQIWTTLSSFLFYFLFEFSLLYFILSYLILFFFLFFIGDDNEFFFFLARV